MPTQTYFLNNRISKNLLSQITDAEIEAVILRISKTLAMYGGVTPVYLADFLEIDRKIVWGWLTQRRRRTKGMRHQIDERPVIPHRVVLATDRRTFRIIEPAEQVAEWLREHARGTLALVALRRRARK